MITFKERKAYSRKFMKVKLRIFTNALDETIQSEAVRVLVQVENIAKLEHDTSQKLREIEQKNYYIDREYKPPEN